MNHSKFRHTCPIQSSPHWKNRGHTIRREDDMGGPVNVLAIDPQSGQIDIASGESTGAVAGF